MSLTNKSSDTTLDMWNGATCEMQETKDLNANQVTNLRILSNVNK